MVGPTLWRLAMPDLFEVRVYHSTTGHCCGRLWDNDEPVQGTREEMEQEGVAFVARFPEYSFEVVPA